MSGSPARMRLRPLLRGLGLVVALALVLALVGRARAQQQARDDAEHNRVVASFARDIEAHYDSLRDPAPILAARLASVAANLASHLGSTAQTDDELRAVLDRLLADVGAAATGLRTATAGAALQVPDALQGETATAVLADLGATRDLTRELLDAVGGLTARIDPWTADLARLRDAAAAFAAIAGRPAASRDPRVIAATWRDERDALVTYAAALDDLQAPPDLAPIVAAHRRYVTASDGWAAEAIDLLTSDRVDAYNARLAEVIGVPDPFGFAADLDTATEAALRVGLIADVNAIAAETEAFSDNVLRRINAARADLIELER